MGPNDRQAIEIQISCTEERKGLLQVKFHFKHGDTRTPFITKKPMKSLGKVFNYSLRDATAIHSNSTKFLRAGQPQWTNQAFLVSSRPGFTNMPSSLDSFMVSCKSEVLQYRESSDHKVLEAEIQVQTGWKSRAEFWLWHKALGAVIEGRVGLGSSIKPCKSKARGKVRRAPVQE